MNSDVKVFTTPTKVITDGALISPTQRSDLAAIGVASMPAAPLGA